MGHKSMYGRLTAAAVAAIALAGCEISGAQPVGYQAELRLADQFYTNGQYARAYELHKNVEAANGSSTEVQLALGETHLRNFAFLKAQSAFREAKELGAGVEADIGLGRVALARNDVEIAKAIFTAINAKDPTNLEALNGLGVALDLAGWHGGAQNRYREALAVNPNLSETRNNLGLSLILSGNYAEAEQVLSELAASELDNAFARQHLAAAIYLQGRVGDALKIAETDLDRAAAFSLFQAFQGYQRAAS